MAAAGLVAGRQEQSVGGRAFHQRIVLVAGGYDDRREDRADPEKYNRKSFLWRRTVPQRWQGDLLHNGQGFGVSSAGLPCSGDEGTQGRDDGPFVGRGAGATEA